MPCMSLLSKTASPIVSTTSSRACSTSIPPFRCPVVVDSVMVDSSDSVERPFRREFSWSAAALTAAAWRPPLCPIREMSSLLSTPFSPRSSIVCCTSRNVSLEGLPVIVDALCRSFPVIMLEYFPLPRMFVVSWSDVTETSAGTWRWFFLATFFLFFKPVRNTEELRCLLLPAAVVAPRPRAAAPGMTPSFSVVLDGVADLLVGNRVFVFIPAAPPATATAVPACAAALPL
mmetsp:Transcript_9819/g.20835  ORF Transcript_9819/g.20835 Transcript_9819/m.20835 type:complete len:231 (+) Transcript_9819:268-960(+)